MPDFHLSTTIHDEPDAPTPWISLADLILATLAMVVLLGMAVLLVYYIHLKRLEQALASFEGKDAVSHQDMEWLEAHRDSEFLSKDQMAVSSSEYGEWLTQKYKPLLPEGHVPIRKDSLACDDLPNPDARIVWVYESEWSKAKMAMKEQGRVPDKPIVLGLDEVGGFRFETGSAELNATFRDKLGGDVLTKIESVVKTYGIEVLEIVGHTDGQPLGAPRGNLDTTLNDLEMGRIDRDFVRSLKPGSNADLGLMRALSVASFLHGLTRRSDDLRIRSLIYRTYSGAQLIDPEQGIIRGALDKDLPPRRRIELRFTRKSISLKE